MPRLVAKALHGERPELAVAVVRHLQLARPRRGGKDRCTRRQQRTQPEKNRPLRTRAAKGVDPQRQIGVGSTTPIIAKLGPQSQT